MGMVLVSRISILASLVVLVAATSVHAGGDLPWPYVGQMSGVSPTSGSMAYACSESNGVLDCHFTQVRISRPTLLTEDQINAAVKSALQSPISAKDCVPYRESMKSLMSGAEVEGITTKAEREDAIASLQALLAYCDAPNETTARAVFAASNARSAQTCNVGTFPFDLSFNWNAVAERWETVSQPNGPCGVVTAAHMEADKADDVKKYNFWTYGQQTLVTNKTGSDPLFGSCAERPNETVDYTWKSAPRLTQCKYVEFKLF